MSKLWIQGILGVIAIASGLVTLIKLFNKHEQFHGKLTELRKEPSKIAHPVITAFFQTYSKEIILIVTTILFASAIVLVAIFVPSTKPVTTLTPTPTITPSAKPTPTTIIDAEDIRLDEIDPLIAKPDAFFIHEWNSFDEIVVSGDVCEQSIGIRIPQEDQNNYYKNNAFARKLHREFIEYSTAYQYQTLQFDYGIDKTTFPDGEESEPSCMCRLVIQSVLSDEFLEDSDNIIFDSGWFNYRLSRQTAAVDLTGVETIRITANWVFDVNPAKPLAFNLAIINPILYAVDS